MPSSPELHAAKEDPELVALQHKRGGTRLNRLCPVSQTGAAEEAYPYIDNQTSITLQRLKYIIGHPSRHERLRPFTDDPASPAGGRRRPHRRAQDPSTSRKQRPPRRRRLTLGTRRRISMVTRGPLRQVTSLESVNCQQPIPAHI